MPNHLHYGDNLSVLRDSIASESVDLVTLDPPFNSNASYNVLFKPPTARNRPRRSRRSTPCQTAFRALSEMISAWEWLA